MQKYNYNQVYDRTIKYFKGDELATKVFIDKYCLKSEDGYYLELTPDDMHWRIAKEVARVEKNYPNSLSEEDIFKLLKDFKYIVFQGSPMAGIGNNNQYISLSNCFYVDHKADSYNAITDIDQKLASIFKRRGGGGCDISKLRPKGGKVNNASLTSTGSVSFAERYSNTAREVGAEGRRAALMISEHVRHPDIYEFVQAKIDKSKITGANVSVKVDNEFMEAVKNNDYYIQRFPIDLDVSEIDAGSLELNELVSLDKGVYVRKVEALDIWDRIVNSAWLSAEPGLLFWDVVEKESPSNGYEGHKVQGVNPCVRGNTNILTDEGYKRIKDVIDKNVNVWNGSNFSQVIPYITGSTDKWYKIRFSDGSELECTSYHIFYIWRGFSQKGEEIQKQANELEEGDKVSKFDFPLIEGNVEKDLYEDGFYCGDGSKSKNKFIIDLHDKKISLKDKFNYSRLSDYTIGYNKIRLYFDRDFDKEFVPDSNYTVNSRLSYLAGLLDSDGTLNSEEGSLSITSINKEFLYNVKLLLNTLGVSSTMSLSKESGYKLMPDGAYGYANYYSQDCYRLLISAYNAKKLMDLGLRTYRVVLNADPNRDASRFIRVTSVDVEYVNKENTYCFNEPINHKGLFNGILTGQCGEVTLPDFDSCRLLAINLFGFVINPYTDIADFDWNRFKSYVQKAQKLMDDLVDLEIEKIDKIIEKINNSDDPEDLKKRERDLWLNIRKKGIETRRTGLGVTAEGDMLAALGYTYGTKYATIFSEQVHKTLAVESYKYSIQMAKERGSFPIWDLDKEKDNPFVNRILQELVDTKYELWYKTFGRRNIANLTIAPTGTVSLMTQTTSGIEPVFMPVYKRRRKVNNKELATFKDDSGDYWEEFKVFHYKFIDWYRVYKDISMSFEETKKYLSSLSDDDLDNLVQQSPYYNSTMNDVDYLEKVRMQGKIQKWVDHSISVTINLPEHIKLDTVKKLYLTAYEHGCKGVTVYREGSRTGVLVSNKSESDNFDYMDAVKRGEELNCDIHRLTALKKRWMVVVGKKYGKPYEVFALEEPESSDFAKKYEKGKIIKRKRGVYDLMGVNHSSQDVLYDISQYYDNDDERASTREYSLMLRHRIHPKFIAETIEKEPGSMVSFKKAIARILRKHYVLDGEYVSGDKCPNCRFETLIYTDGCVKCSNCDFQKC